MTKHVTLLRGALAVRADATDAKALIAGINTAFEEFKGANDEKLKGIDAKFDDVVSSEKVERIEADLGMLVSNYEALQAKLSAAELGGSGEIESAEDMQYRSDFNSWFREGEKEADVKSALKSGKISAASSVGVNEDGGFAAPVEWDRSVTDKLLEVGQMRRHASSQPVTGQGFKKLYNMHGATSGWVGETAARPATDTPTLSEYEFSFGEIYANPSATQRSLEDPLLDIEAWLSSEVQLEFAVQEGTAFISGDGVNKPKGFLEYTAAKETALAASARHPLGPIVSKTSGVANGVNPDSFINLAYELPDERSQGAAYYASRSTHAVIRTMKDADGRYIWHAPYQEGQPALVNGRPIYELDGMQDSDTDGNIACAFGNMAMTYRIFDRRGVMILRDPYTNKPYVSFYTTKRVGGGLWNPEYMRYMTIGA